MKSRQKIYKTDCIDFMEKYNGKKPNVIVTSPPYNLDKKYNTYNDKRKDSEYLHWVLQWGKSIYDMLDVNGSFSINIGYTAKNPKIPFKVLEVLYEFFILQNVIHWIKSISIPERDFSTEHFKPINTNRFVN